jgi:hypothetical protein
MKLIETLKNIKIENKKKFIFFLVIIAILVIGIGWGIISAIKYIHYRGNTKTWSEEMKEAEKNGKKTEMKILVQIAPPPPGSNPNDPSSTARGDILASYPADKEFSVAEKEGFLIINVELTEKEAELIVKPIQEMKEMEGINGSKKQKATNLKAHRFGVNLSDIGISEDDFRGREINNKVYNDKMIYEK